MLKSYTLYLLNTIFPAPLEGHGGTGQLCQSGRRTLSLSSVPLKLYHSEFPIAFFFVVIIQYLVA